MMKKVLGLGLILISLLIIGCGTDEVSEEEFKEIIETSSEEELEVILSDDSEAAIAGKGYFKYNKNWMKISKTPSVKKAKKYILKNPSFSKNIKISCRNTKDGVKLSKMFYGKYYPSNKQNKCLGNTLVYYKCNKYTKNKYRQYSKSCSTGCVIDSGVAKCAKQCASNDWTKVSGECQPNSQLTITWKKKNNCVGSKSPQQISCTYYKSFNTGGGAFPTIVIADGTSSTTRPSLTKPPFNAIKCDDWEDFEDAKWGGISWILGTLSTPHFQPKSSEFSLKNCKYDPTKIEKVKTISGGMAIEGACRAIDNDGDCDLVIGNIWGQSSEATAFKFK